MDNYAFTNLKRECQKTVPYTPSHKVQVGLEKMRRNISLLLICLISCILSLVISNFPKRFQLQSRSPSPIELWSIPWILRWITHTLWVHSNPRVYTQTILNCKSRFILPYTQVFNFYLFLKSKVILLLFYIPHKQKSCTEMTCRSSLNFSNNSHIGKVRASVIIMAWTHNPFGSKM